MYIYIHIQSVYMSMCAFYMYVYNVLIVLLSSWIRKTIYTPKINIQ